MVPDNIYISKWFHLNCYAYIMGPPQNEDFKINEQTLSLNFNFYFDLLFTSINVFRKTDYEHNNSSLDYYSNLKPLAELIVLLLAYTRKWRIVILLGSWLTDQTIFIELIVE